MVEPFNIDSILQELIASAQGNSATEAAQAIVVQQLASQEWHEGAQQKVQQEGGAWKGHWTFVRADCNPDLYWWMSPDHGSARLIRQSTSGQVFYGERYHEGKWEPVCIKKKSVTTPMEKQQARMEITALEAVKVVMQDQPAPHCVSFLLESYPPGWQQPGWLVGQQEAYFITEYEEGQEVLYFLQPLFLARADNLPGWRAELLQTVKECFRQILKNVALIHGCGLAHVNIKNNKILCKKLADGTIQCRITDLGSALREDVADAVVQLRICAANMAPEMLLDRGPPSRFSYSYQAAEMWALGCLLVQMLLGIHFIGSGGDDGDNDPPPSEHDEQIRQYVATCHAKWVAAHAAGSAVPHQAGWLAELIPDVTEYTCAARLLRRLLHPDPLRRPTVQQVLDDDFLHA